MLLAPLTLAFAALLPPTLEAAAQIEPPSLRDALRGLEDKSLETMRAGAATSIATLDEAQRAELESLRDPALEEQRAGDISDRDTKLILITVAVVVVIAILL
jgi:hypothetical protein